MKDFLIILCNLSMNYATKTLPSDNPKYSTPNDLGFHIGKMTHAFTYYVYVCTEIFFLLFIVARLTFHSCSISHIVFIICQIRFVDPAVGVKSREKKTLFICPNRQYNKINNHKFRVSSSFKTVITIQIGLFV